MAEGFITILATKGGQLLGDLLNILFKKGVEDWNRPHEGPKTQAINRQIENENAREADCKTVVMDFISTFGFMTKLVISKEELGEKIYTDKITAQELNNELFSRMAEIPGTYLGKRHFTNATLDIKLPYSLRSKHAYIIGRSGSGKTNIIRTMAMQDIFFGCGVGVIAPEAELLTEELLPYIPENRIDDIVYVNPDDRQNPISLNPLHMNEGESIDDKVEEFTTLFKRAVGETGHRMDDLLDHTLYALINRKGSNLEDIPRFLSRDNPAFRNEVLRDAPERIRYFFEERYPRMDKDADGPVVARINRFTRREAVRNILCQRGRAFNIRKSMDEGKVLLFNLSDGILGNESSQLLGQIIVSQIQLATMARARIPSANRRPFYLYLDEFPTFCGVSEDSYAAMLSRARKYEMGLILASQNTRQIPEALLEEIFGNVTTFLAFNVSHRDAHKLSNEYFVDLGVEGEHVPPHEFQRLDVGQAIAKIGKTVLPLQTVLAPKDYDPARAEMIIERSRQNYGNGANWEGKYKQPELKFLPPPEYPDEDIDPRRVF